MTDNCCPVDIQYLIDNEITDDSKLRELLYHLSHCDECYSEYKSLVNFSKKINFSKVDDPDPKWFEELEKKKGRKISRVFGYFLVLIPYLTLGVFAFSQLFKDNRESFLIKLSIGAIITGIVILLSITIVDRIKESKTDKYKEIIK